MTVNGTFDEIRGAGSQAVRPEFAALDRWIVETPSAELDRRRKAAWA